MNRAKKSVLFVSFTPFLGGGEVYLYSLCLLLKNLGYEIGVFCKSDKLKERLNNIGIANYRVRRYSYWNYFFNLFSIIKIIKSNRIDHVHLNGNRELFFAPFLRLFHIGLTATKHTYPYPKGSLLNYLRNLLIILCIKFTDKTICVSQSLRDSLVGMGTPENKLVVIRNSPRRHFHEMRGRSEAPKKEPGEPLNLLMLARIEPLKGYRELCIACKGLPGIKLSFAGDGDILDLYRHVDHDQVKYLGYLDDPLEAIRSADVVVLPSFWEGGCPLALLEGMALAKPVIATRIPSIEEFVSDGVEGFLVNPGDLPGLRNAIARMAGEERRRQQMGGMARKKIEEKFSMQTWGDGYVSFFSQTFDRRHDIH